MSKTHPAAGRSNQFLSSSLLHYLNFISRICCGSCFIFLRTKSKRSCPSLLLLLLFLVVGTMANGPRAFYSFLSFFLSFFFKMHFDTLRDEVGQVFFFLSFILFFFYQSYHLTTFASLSSSTTTLVSSLVGC